jgi:serine/threonine protein kinase
MKKTLVGTMVAEKYVIEGVLARGGFSIVYRGVHLAMKRPVALKVMRINKDVDPTWLERFSREARLISQLEHQNTITIYDFGRVRNEYLYIVMELVEGLSLSRRLIKDGPFEARSVAEIAKQVCDSLAEAHRLGILHRDMKPSNIMLAGRADAGPSIRVLDFGIAKILEPEVDIQASLTQHGVFIGTPRYASPEQLRKEALDARSDIYGVGMLMWELITGVPAVPETDFGTAVSYHLGSQPWALPVEIECPDPLRSIVHKAIEKDATRRYFTCEEMSDDLDAFLHGRPLPSGADVLAEPSGEGSYDDFVDSIFGEAQEVFEGILERSSEANAPVGFIGLSESQATLRTDDAEKLSPADDLDLESVPPASMERDGQSPSDAPSSAPASEDHDEHRTRKAANFKAQNPPVVAGSVSAIDLRLAVVVSLVLVVILSGIIVVLVGLDSGRPFSADVVSQGATFSESQILDELASVGWNRPKGSVSPHVIRRGHQEVSISIFDRNDPQLNGPASSGETFFVGTKAIRVTQQGATEVDAVYHVIGVLAAMRARAEASR